MPLIFLITGIIMIAIVSTFLEGIMMWIGIGIGILSILAGIWVIYSSYKKDFVKSGESEQ